MIYFIVNPTAGNGKPLKARSYIQQIMKDKNIPYKIANTMAPGSAKALAESAARNNATAVIVLGGDGTVQEAANGLIGTSTPLGVIPLGSGNDFIKSLTHNNLTSKNIDEVTNFYLCKILDNIHKPRYIDTADVNGRMMVNICGVGIDVVVAEMVEGMKRYFGKLSYLIALLQVVFTYKALKLEIYADGQLLSDADTTLFVAANGRQYGGGFVIAPSAKVNDGWLTTCHIGKASKIKRTLLFAGVVLGFHQKLGYVSFMDCKELLIKGASQKNTLKVNIDGNVFEYKDDINIRLLPKTLLILGAD